MNEMLKDYLKQLDQLRKREEENAKFADFIYIMES